MGKGISADVPQMKQFMRDLRKVSPALAKATSRRFREAAGKVAADAKRRAPARSGRLQRSIKPSTAVRVGASVRASVPYSAIHEYGGRHRVHGTDTWVTQAARPYMRPAVIANRNTFFREANEAVKDAAREAGFK